ncbi:hypothetical protein L3Q72_02080 [Vibrio sp. JC009]|uniref:hypothetical protein n=1 Tax=Vibrio sp. JC009 TaxID=2912314 RepID=UPI0023B1889D|nr:hypothetical protein [Vibrio sp. JC009]WED22217.1 hypothetical protein L3Q72_02080 [Vibrio sp. JC009]
MRFIYYPLVFVLFVYSFVPFYYPLSTKAKGFPTERVAHAGGAIDNHTYTNSYEALDYNLNNGFKYFEIDFLFTSDKHLVCAHDWRSFYPSKGPHRVPSLNEFKSIVDEEKTYKNCTLKGLSHWMNKNTGTVIITDIKSDNLRGLKKIYQQIPEAKDRVIPQIYDPDNLKEVRKIGFKNVIWALYGHLINNNYVLYKIKDFYGNIAITMPKERAITDLPLKLKKLGIPTYVHTVNNEGEMVMFMEEKHISEIYTDYLIP